ncbi:MAG TPA: hypothetical protein VFV49_17700 [Thermoanaerobaculia bacterium]|nr:hypothetical protein [Thermoanaerobaculia bacterium]
MSRFLVALLSLNCLLPLAAQELVSPAGMAMKSMPVEMMGVEMHRPGTILGKALESLSGGSGEILVLLSMQ